MTNITKGKKKDGKEKKDYYKLEGLLKSKSVFYAIFLIKIVPSQSKVGEV